MTVQWSKRACFGAFATTADRFASLFPPHDLTHFAVESVLGYKRGFFGHIGEGWEIDDTTGKGTRGPLPLEAGEV